MEQTQPEVAILQSVIRRGHYSSSEGFILGHLAPFDWHGVH